MPHFIIECSDNVIAHTSPQEIMNTVYTVAESTGLFAPNDIKVRIRPYEYYKLGEGKEDFLHIFANIMEGRTTEQKTEMSQKIITELNKLLPNIGFLSINVRDFELATYSNKSLINPLNTNYDRFF
jgi:5-carboxymethyl-2-hydroxymuconate isomerase